jgi:dihydrofolate reductase
MRKIIVSNYVSLDGFFAGPNGEYDWFVWDEETAEYVKEMLASIDTLLFGRVTYELMASYWPTASPPTEDPVIIDAMNNLPKIVFSRTLEKVEWNNSCLKTILRRSQGETTAREGHGDIRQWQHCIDFCSIRADR